jgi:1-acyl-sn-glycerol-3-phosphate acyltransferase
MVKCTLPAGAASKLWHQVHDVVQSDSNQLPICPAEWMGTVQKELSLKAKSANVRVRGTYHTPMFVYRALWLIINLLMRLIYRYHAEGQENVPRQGPVILVVNHLHLVDPGMVVCAVWRQIVTLAADKWLYNSTVRAFLRGAGSIFVNRGEVDRTALRLCLDVLKRGKALAIAPEGTRSPNAQMQRGKAGVAYIARQANAIIVPIGSWGQERLGEWKPWHRPECHTVIGRPFRLDLGEGKMTSERLQELADAIMIQIARLVPESYRGYYADQVSALGSHDLPLGIIPA